MSCEDYLDERAERLEKSRDMQRRDAAALSWLNQGTSPEARLLKFDSWVRKELAERIDWAWAGPMKARRIEQCRTQLEALVLGLWRRGWMLDGQRLAKHIRTALDDVGAAQRAGRVKDFWPFFRSVVDRYVGTNSEEIKAEAMAAGSAVAQVFKVLQATAPSLPETMAQRREETVRAKQSRIRRAAALQEADKAQGDLFSGPLQ